MEEWKAIIINGITIPVELVSPGEYLPRIFIGNREYLVAESLEEAGEAATQYWKNLEAWNPDAFTWQVGEEAAALWEAGKKARPDRSPDRSRPLTFRQWLKLWKQHPEKLWASYDEKLVQAQVEDTSGKRRTIYLFRTK